jgi:hypothetical protein
MQDATDSGFETLATRGREARATGDLPGAVSLFHRARTLAVEQGLQGDEVLSVLIQEAICATDAGLLDQAGAALDEFDRLTGPTPPAWATAQSRLARAAGLDARARDPRGPTRSTWTHRRGGR